MTSALAYWITKGLLDRLQVLQKVFLGFMARLKEKRVKDTLTVYPIQREKIHKTSYEHLTIIFDKMILKTS